MIINNLNFTSFIRTAEAGSFNKAAEELFITSAALIKQIQLENDIGVRFFDWTHRGLTQTKAGGVALQGCQIHHRPLRGSGPAGLERHAGGRQGGVNRHVANDARPDAHGPVALHPRILCRRELRTGALREHRGLSYLILGNLRVRHSKQVT